MDGWMGQCNLSMWSNKSSIYFYLSTPDRGSLCSHFDFRKKWSTSEMGTEERKLFHFKEVAKHNQPKDCWLIINGKVYDVTTFLDDHPGGDDPLLQVTGKDASDDFEDVGHSNNARNVMKEYYIGDIDLSTMPAKVKHEAPVKIQQVQKVSTVGGSGFLVKFLQFLVPFGLLAIAFGIRSYSKTL